MENFNINSGLSTTELLSKYRGCQVCMDDFKDYPRFALEYFHNTSEVLDPNLHITIEQDITALRDAYQSIYRTEESTFTSFLVWKLLRAVIATEFLTFRHIEGKWYRFNNLPLFFPVAVGGAKRFTEVVVEDAGNINFAEFSKRYRTGLKKALAQDQDYQPVPNEIWKNMWFIGNLNYMRFTSFGIHLNANDTARPVFYFGKRFERDGRLLTPLYARIDHATGDPFILNQMLEDFQSPEISD